MADRLKGIPNALYEPSNGSEGEWFMEQFCFKCTKWPDSPEAKKQCQIAMKALAYNTGDKEYPMQWHYNQDGNPVCSSFKSREDYNRERRLKRPGRNRSIIATDMQNDLFTAKGNPS